MKVREYSIIRAILFIIITITSYYVITAGYNAFVTFQASKMITEGFQGGCHDIEFAQFTSMCANSMRGSGANRPITPQVNNVMKSLGLGVGTASKKPTATDANAAFLRLLRFINPSRNTQAAVPFRDMIKCLFFTCDSYVKVVPDLTDIVKSGPLLFAGAKKPVAAVPVAAAPVVAPKPAPKPATPTTQVEKLMSFMKIPVPKPTPKPAPAPAPAPSQPTPADDLRTVLAYLDTRRSVQQDPLFFKTLRDLFMAERASTLRNDIEFGRLSQLVVPEHVFRAL